MAKKVMTTLHLPEDTRDTFRRLVTEQRRDMSDMAAELMKRWCDGYSSKRTDRMQMEHAVTLLSKAVAEQLVQNPQWARDAVIGAGLGLPGSNVFTNRFMHFIDEKQELGKRLARWILDRSLWHVANGRRVVLICDSGTTVFWFMKAFGEAIDERFKTAEGARSLSQLSVVTNNIPGAEAFVTYASLHSVAVGENKTERISDLIGCRILAGAFLPEYAAITGDDTERDLSALAEKMQNEPRSKSKGKPVFIAITTGNWIAMRGKDGASLPSFFARGHGHGPFKKRLLEICEESFALTPLGKLLVDTSVERLNELLHYSEAAVSPSHRSYDSIVTPAKKARNMKVVTTIRQKQSVLRDHSAHLCRKLGSFTMLDPSDVKTTKQALSPIEEVQHLLFPFDQFADQTVKAQMEIELPHDATREPAFSREVFSIHD